MGIGVNLDRQSEVAVNAASSLFCFFIVSPVICTFILHWFFFFFFLYSSSKIPYAYFFIGFLTYHVDWLLFFGTERILSNMNLICVGARTEERTY